MSEAIPEWVHDYAFGVFVIPVPEPLRSVVADLRRRFDPSSAAIVDPHITLTAPLAEEPNDIARADLGASIADALPPFDLRYGPARRFPGSEVIYLTVEPAEPVLILRTRAHATGLFRRDWEHLDDFVPHITIRESRRNPEVDDAREVLTETDRRCGRGRFVVQAVELWRPASAGVFVAVESIRLAGS
jgi:2'-5' RNA ligase